MEGTLYKKDDKWFVRSHRTESDMNNSNDYPVHPNTIGYGVNWNIGDKALFILWREGEKNPGDKMYHTVYYAKLFGTDISVKNELHDVDFVSWLLRNCTTKAVIGSTTIGYYWTLNKDYENSWDGEDVKLYTTNGIFEYYNKHTINKI